MSICMETMGVWSLSIVLDGTMSICMETMGVWNSSMVLYGTMSICMETMGIWKSSLESLDTWFGTLYFVYGLGLETPKLISF